MTYHLKIGEKTINMDTAQGADESDLRVMVEDRPYDVRYRIIDDTLIRLLVEGKWYTVHVVQNGNAKEVFLKGNTFWFQDLDEIPARPPGRRPPRAGGRGRPGTGEDPSGEITPPTPAIVVRILAQEGDWVQKGQGLVVVSAMKMETTLSAPRDGVVSRINTSVDARVAPGDILVEMEAEEESHE